MITSEVLGVFFRARGPIDPPVVVPRFFDLDCKVCEATSGMLCETGCPEALKEFDRLHGIVAVLYGAPPCYVCGAMTGACQSGKLQGKEPRNADVAAAGIYMDCLDGTYED